MTVLSRAYIPRRKATTRPCQHAFGTIWLNPSATHRATSIQSSDQSTLTCSSSIAGDYKVTIRGAGGAGPRTTTVDVHVASISPAAPAPSTIRGLVTTFIDAITGAIIMVVVAGTVLVLRRSRQSKA